MINLTLTLNVEFSVSLNGSIINASVLKKSQLEDGYFSSTINMA